MTPKDATQFTSTAPALEQLRERLVTIYTTRPRGGRPWQTHTESVRNEAERSGIYLAIAELDHVAHVTGGTK